MSVDAVGESSEGAECSAGSSEQVSYSQSTTCWGRDWTPALSTIEPSIFILCCDQEKIDQLRAEAQEHRQNATVAGGAAIAGAAASGAYGAAGNVGGDGVFSYSPG
jgi:hypothetical protein